MATCHTCRLNLGRPLWDGNFPVEAREEKHAINLVAPINPLNAILSLLQPLNRYRSTPCDRKRDWKALSRSISHPHTGRISQPPCSKPIRGLTRAIVAL